MLILNLFFVSFSALNPDLLKDVVVASIVLKFLVEEMDNLVAGHVQKLSSMGDNDYCAFTAADVIF